MAEAVRTALAITIIATGAHVQVREKLYISTLLGLNGFFFTLKTVYSFLFLNAEVSEGIIRESRNGSHYYMQVRTPEHKRSDKHQGKIN